MQCDYLWKIFLQGDKSALGELFINYYDSLFRYGIKLCKKQDLTVDCIQELFLKLWKYRNSLKPVRELKPYLFKCLRNHLYDELVMLIPTENIEDHYYNILDVSFNHQDFSTTNEISEEVLRALNHLSPRQREIIYLRYFEDLDFETISDILSIKVQSVRNTVHKGIEILRRTINPSNLN